MDRIQHLKLCENCTNRNIDHQWGVFCKLHGDIPNFETQCPDYGYNETTQKRSDSSKKKRNIRRVNLEQ